MEKKCIHAGEKTFTRLFNQPISQNYYVDRSVALLSPSSHFSTSHLHTSSSHTTASYTTFPCILPSHTHYPIQSLSNTHYTPSHRLVHEGGTYEYKIVGVGDEGVETSPAILGPYVAQESTSKIFSRIITQYLSNHNHYFIHHSPHKSTRHPTSPFSPSSQIHLQKRYRTFLAPSRRQRRIHYQQLCHRVQEQ